MSEQVKVYTEEHQVVGPEQSKLEAGKKMFAEPEISEPEDILDVTFYFGVAPGSGVGNGA